MNISKWLKRILFGKSPKHTFIRGSILAISCFITFKFVLLPVKIEGKSMEPTYRNGGFNFVNTLRYYFHEPHRGDIVGIKMAGKKVMLLKRVVGLPGERLSFKDGVLIINGEPILEEYIKESCDWNMAEVEVGSDEFFVVGDNRMMPIEFHVYGRVSRSKIVGGPLF